MYVRIDKSLQSNYHSIRRDVSTFRLVRRHYFSTLSINKVEYPYISGIVWKIQSREYISCIHSHLVNKYASVVAPHRP